MRGGYLQVREGEAVRRGRGLWRAWRRAAHKNSFSCGKAENSAMSQPRFMKVVEVRRKSKAWRDFANRA